MDIKVIMNVGVGRCGNKLVDDLMSRDKRYAGMMVNSAIGDMQSLVNFKRASTFLIPNADGSGRDRELASEYAKLNVQRFADEILRYQQYELFVVYFSMDGGTGSGATPTFLRAMRKMLPNKRIMVVGVMPRLSASKLSLENSLACWNDLMKLRDDGVINSFRFVDNDKREHLYEINESVVSDLDTSFKLHSFDVDGVIDQRDSFRINTANDYGMLLNLNNNIDDVKMAVENAKKNSVFVMPRNNDCDYLGILLQGGRFNANETKRLFNIYETDFTGASNGRNIILATGINIPVQKTELIKIALDEMREKSRNRIKDSSLFVKSSDDRNKDQFANLEEEVVVKKANAVSSDELDRLFDDSFWN